MGNRLKQTFAFLRAGARKIVRDRRGELVGFIGAAGEFTFYRPEYHAYFQPVVINEIKNSTIPRGFRLSIDLELSRMALESLGDKRGSIVLVKPGTGEILAAVSDEKTVKKMGGGSSPAFEQMLEPASILKLVTLTAALRKGLNPDMEITGMNCRGAKRYSGKILYCPSAQGELYGLEHALAVSCNTAFADLGVAVGWEKMLAELRLFGFDMEQENPFPFGRIIIDKGDKRALADLAIGLENTVITPVHGAFIAAVFANNGTWVYPELVSGRDGFTGLCPTRIKSIGGIAKGVRILNEEWLPPIRDAMWAVTRYGGTAAFIAPIGFQVSMKTGTGGNARNGFHINYIGFGPGDRGDIAFCVRVTGKRTSYRIRRAGYRVNRDLLTGLKRLMDRGGL
jgi:peptidoglycan glycosyltransferase